MVAAFLANLGIASAKLVAFVITGSAAMLAETIHSVAGRLVTEASVGTVTVMVAELVAEPLLLLATTMTLVQPLWSGGVV